MRRLKVVNFAKNDPLDVLAKDEQFYFFPLKKIQKGGPLDYFFPIFLLDETPIFGSLFTCSYFLFLRLGLSNIIKSLFFNTQTRFGPVHVLRQQIQYSVQN